MQPYFIKGLNKKMWEKQVEVAKSRGWDVKKSGDTWMGNYRIYWAEMTRKEVEQ